MYVTQSISLPSKPFAVLCVYIRFVETRYHSNYLNNEGRGGGLVAKP